MKTFIAIFLFFTAVPLRAQVTLEHKYPNSRSFGLVLVDSAEWKYVDFHGAQIAFYNLDHSLDRVDTIQLPHTRISGLIRVARNLFSRDSSLDLLLDASDSSSNIVGLRLLHQDGSLLLKCDTCSVATGYSNFADIAPSFITSTSSGVKLTVVKYQDNSMEVYSLPGRIPGSSQMLSVNPNSQSSWPQLESAAYPNPSTGHVRIAYDLPSGVQSGEIVLTKSDGREFKRYHITNAFNDLLIEEGDLPSGSYFYKVVTSRGESAAQRIVRER
jgi:hypothetical protein